MHYIYIYNYVNTVMSAVVYLGSDLYFMASRGLCYGSHGKLFRLLTSRPVTKTLDNIISLNQ